MDAGTQPRENRKRWSGIQLQYGLPTPTHSPKLENEQWSPIEHRVNALAEVQRLQERFAALARSENARVLGTPPRNGSRPASFDGGACDGFSPRRRRSLLAHRKSQSFDSSIEAWRESTPISDDESSDRTHIDLSDESDHSKLDKSAHDLDEENDDDDDPDNSILMLRARDLQRAIRETKRRHGISTTDPATLAEATTALGLAFKAWCVALLIHGARGELAIRFYISLTVAVLLVAVLL